jgi:LmbE family N-acetylglucosaminyl deacetylase
VSYTLVSFHAHPDDEVLLTGGTLARCAAEGHRVVLAVATAGERGLTGGSDVDGPLGRRRQVELAAAAQALGVARVVEFGYGDSGMDGPVPPDSFCAQPVARAAERLADLLTDERADVLTIYDAVGGYGHRDHVRVHDVGVAAAAMVGPLSVLQATVARESLQRAVRTLNRIGVRPGGVTARDLDHAFCARADITHVIDVRHFVPQKVRALKAHASQASGGADVRTVALLSRLPRPVARMVLGREWFVELARPAGRNATNDPFASVTDR